MKLWSCNVLSIYASYSTVALFVGVPQEKNTKCMPTENPSLECMCVRGGYITRNCTLPPHFLPGLIPIAVNLGMRLPTFSILQVELYVQSLPSGCVPKKGKEGEEQRVQRFTQQMPVYDFSLDVCHKLTELEKKRMLKFVEKRRKESYGVGTVELEMSEEGRVRATVS